MIVYDLCCDAGHRFEGWFGSSDDYAGQSGRGLVTCPQCGSTAVDKAPMAPSVPRKGNQLPAQSAMQERHPVSSEPVRPEVVQALKKLAEAQKRSLKDSTWVGDAFAENSRAMHYGELDTKPIHGQTTLEEAHSLLDEGIAVAPLPFPVAPPDELN